MIRLGVLGTARVVPYGLLAPAKVTAGVEVNAVASRSLQKAEEFAARFGIQRGFGSYEALLESKDIDAVYIALPPVLHYKWVRRAIEAGKHVLCEKPLAANARLAEELTLLAKKHNRCLVEAMHIRYMEKLRRQRELLATGEFGRLLRIEACFRAPYVRMTTDDFRMRFELGGGAALDVGCYAVSCLRYLAGEEPEIVSVQHKCSGPQIDRWMRATLRFPSGVGGIAEFGFRGFYLPRGDVTVACEQGSIKWRGEGLALEKNATVVRERMPATPTYQLQLEAFIRMVRGQVSDALAPDDAVSTARVVDAIYEKAGFLLRGTSQNS